MYRALLGAQFDALPEALRAVHADDTVAVFGGRCDVERGSSLLSRLIGAVAGLPVRYRGVLGRHG